MQRQALTKCSLTATPPRGTYAVSQGQCGRLSYQPPPALDRGCTCFSRGLCPICSSLVCVLYVVKKISASVVQSKLFPKHRKTCRAAPGPHRQHRQPLRAAPAWHAMALECGSHSGLCERAPTWALDQCGGWPREQQAGPALHCLTSECMLWVLLAGSTMPHISCSRQHSRCSRHAQVLLHGGVAAACFSTSELCQASKPRHRPSVPAVTALNMQAKAAELCAHHLLLPGSGLLAPAEWPRFHLGLTLGFFSLLDHAPLKSFQAQTLFVFSSAVRPDG